MEQLAVAILVVVSFVLFAGSVIEELQEEKGKDE